MNLISKNFNQNNVRIILIYEQEYFIAKDLADILEYSNTSKAIQDHCKKVTNLKELLNSNEPLPLKKEDIEAYRKQLGSKWATIQLIPESDIWRLIIKSQMPEADKIEQWIFEEVLPQIRKTGSYQIQTQKPTPANLQTLLDNLKIADELLKLTKQKSKLELLQLDKIMQDISEISLLETLKIDLKNSYFSVSELGEYLGKSGAEVNLLLAKKNFQFSENGVWELLENGKEFCFETKNQFSQLKWKLEILEKI